MINKTCSKHVQKTDIICIIDIQQDCKCNTCTQRQVKQGEINMAGSQHDGRDT